MREKAVLGGVVLLGLILLAGCTPNPAPVTPADKLYQTYGQAIDIANSIYEASMVAAGQAHANHTITDEQLAKVKAVGSQMQQTLVVAKGAFLTYLKTQDATSAGNLTTTLIAVQQILTELTQILQQTGVTK